MGSFRGFMKNILTFAFPALMLFLVCGTDHAFARDLRAVETLGDCLFKVVVHTCTGQPAPTGGHCISRMGLNGCQSPDDVCVSKPNRFYGKCMKKSGNLPSWSNPVCFECGGHVTVEEHEEKTIIMMKKHKKVMGVHNHKAHFHPVGEGASCSTGDMSSGCKCAGKFWACARTFGDEVKACDVGLRCIKKNDFYAVCASEEREKQLAKMGWDMTPLPCGKRIGIDV